VTPNCFCAGLDLGKQTDPSALVLLQWQQEPWGPVIAGAPPPRPPPRPTAYEVATIKRWPLGTPYRQIADDTARFFTVTPLRSSVRRPLLVLDATGVGNAVAEMVRERMFSPEVDGYCCDVTITAGSAVTRDMTASGRWRVAKKQLVSVMQVLLGNRRLHIADTLPEARTLKDELGTFSVKINPDTANESFEAWREREHDDLVLAAALAAWAAVKLDHFLPAPPRPPQYSPYW
jgi:hypothetical protein